MPKTIFHSTEKSNFILNMTEKQYAKLASIGLIGSCVIVSLFTLIPEIFTTSTYTFSAAGLAVCGVYCMIMTIIALIKKYLKGSTLFAVCAFAFMLLWGVLSVFRSTDMYVGLYGFPERCEGLLALIFYWCIFTAAASIKKKKAAEAVFNGLILAGMVNSTVALIQIFTGGLSHYEMASLEIRTNSASGLAQSPLFLAMLLTLSLTAALTCAVTTKVGRFRNICLIASAVFGFVMMMTYSFIGICGLAFSVIAAAVCVLVTKGAKKKILSVIPTIIGAAAAVIIVNAGLIGNISSYRLYDGRELWWADSYMRIGSSGDFNYKVNDIDDTLDVYLNMNSKTMDIISDNKLTGTGPDQLAFPQIYTIGPSVDDDPAIVDIIQYNTGIFDRVYNEYLYTAATRGIPSLIALIAIVLTMLVSGFKAMKKGRGAVGTTLFLLVLGSALLFLIGCGNITFSPVFWAVAGLACALPNIDEKEVTRVEKKPVAEKK